MDNSKVSTKTLITLAAIISLASGLLDVIIGLSSVKSELLLFRSILLPLAITTVIAFISFFILWFAIGHNVCKRLKLNPNSVAAAFGTLIVITIILISFNYYSFQISSLSRLLINFTSIFVVSLVALFITYFLSNKIKNSENSNQVYNFLSLIIPVVLLELLLFICFYKSGTISIFVSSLAFVLAGLLSCFLCFRLSGKSLYKIVVGIFVVIIIASPVGYFISTGTFNKSDEFEESSSNKIKNIILLSIDTLRADVLSSYGSTEVLTPNMDKLAIDGTLFREAYSPAPWTLPAFSSIMTGVNALVHKTVVAGSRLPDAFTTIAEYARDNGYRTGAIGHNVHLNQAVNLNQGFMEYNFFPKRTELVNSFGGTLINLALPAHFKSDASTSDLTEIAINWLKEHQDQDFFLWIHYFDPHIPYSPPEQYIEKRDAARTSIGNNFTRAGVIRNGLYSPSKDDKKRIRQLYDAEVRYVDDNIGKLLDVLVELDLYNDSLIILTSDHGEEFWEHGGFEHGHTLYNEIIHVPLLIKLPKNEKTHDIEIQVTTQSILPTILELADIKHDDNPHMASSLVPLLKNNPSEYHIKPIISTSLLYNEDRESAIFDESKYIRTIVTEKEEIYDLQNDPGEQFPLPKSEVLDIITEAKEILEEHKVESAETSSYYGVDKGEKVELDEERKERLKALDYIQ